MKKFIVLLLAVVLLCSFAPAAKKKGKTDKTISAANFSGLKFRSIGPAFTSGRIADFAVNPNNHKEYYVAVASGNIWKTKNGGLTWKPVFDKYGSYSIGCLAMDPSNTNVVWAGTGENNHQRALGYGDGVYKTVDGGKSWKNMGLKNSRHIGTILINPKNSDVVYVAAEGSAWGPGGDRGLYKTSDGGKTWQKVLNISENTGINCMVMDPRNPDVIYASSEQRRRHVHTKIGGGPETAIYKTTDSGRNWKKIKSGLPNVHMGGIGLAISPVNPDVIYAIIEAADNMGGFFRSTDRGESWAKMSSHVSSGQYYNEIYCDPKDVNKVFSVETVSHYTEDGGKTFKRLGLKARHVDDHALWIDPDDTDHLIIGGDGGIYESWDMGANWRQIRNLPVTQFYRVAVDNSLPFYYVYGGTQDNNSMGGPSRNTSSFGVVSDEWFITNGGDGFWSQIDPKDPNIVYAEAQYGNMVRYDRKSGERTYIRPQPRKGEKTYKWNWNTPLLISPHSNTRIYCAANKVFRSDNRGDSWTVISDDLTAKIDRNKWKVMGKYWSADAVKKDVSTSQYGTIVSFDESPLEEGLLYAGTDDGLIQVKEPGKESWRQIENFPGVPKYTYISDIHTSRFDAAVVFASFDNRKRDDFNPYLLLSSDRGKTWKSISANLPKNGTVHTVAQDFKNKNLLFAGTEFGVFFSYNLGKEWIQLKSGIPTIAVRDIAIHKRENDLVLATFGRGFYILDDYTPLRQFSPQILKKEAHIFPIKDALMYVQTRGKYGQGADYYAAKNPAYGAVFTYYLKSGFKTQKQARKKKEAELFKKGEPMPMLTWDDLRKEGMEPVPYLLFTITDDQGKVVRELKKKPGKGINRITWDLGFADPSPIRFSGKFSPFAKEGDGFPVMPGKYKVSISKVVNNQVTQLVPPQEFVTKVLNNTTLPAKDRSKLIQFHQKVSKLTRVLMGAIGQNDELLKKIARLKQTILATPEGSQKLMVRAAAIESELNEIDFAFKGHRPRASREEVPPSHVPIRTRLWSIFRATYASTSAPGKTQYDSMNIIVEELKPILNKLETILNVDLKQLEQEMDKANSPWTPGRLLKLDQ